MKSLRPMRHRAMMHSLFSVSVMSVILLCLDCQGIDSSLSAAKLGIDWYPSTITGYAPYQIFSAGPNFPVPLKPGQTRFTKDEVIRYAGEFIDERQKLIGANSKSLRLVEVANKGTEDNQSWDLVYEQTTPYEFKIAKYGRVMLNITGGEVRFLESTVIPAVPVPKQALISDEDIRKRLIGQILKYYDIATTKQYKITAKTLVTFKELVIFPSLKEDTLEVRLCRELEVRSASEEKKAEGARWAVFVDVITGEMVHQNYLLKA